MSYEIKKVLMIYAQTPLHVGAGISCDIIDMPIQREVHTGYPVIPASSLKGSLRSRAELSRLDSNLIKAAFGNELNKDSTTVGNLSIGDCRILAFPVRSLSQGFLWVTCPLVLNRFYRDLRLAGFDEQDTTLSFILEDSELWAPENTKLPDRIFLEEVEFEVTKSKEAHSLAQYLAGLLPAETGDYFIEKFKRDLVLISDRNFSYFIKHCTQISARIQLTSAKITGKEGNLWYEESLPSDTVMYSLLMATGQRLNNISARRLMDFADGEVLKDNLLQVGGNETVGQGWCWVSLVGGGNHDG